MTPPLWTRDFSLAFAANFLMAFAFYLLMPTLPLYLTEQLHMSKAVAGLIMSIYVIAALAMRPFSGFLIDMLPRKGLYLVSFALFVLFTGFYLGAVSVLAFVVVRFLHGLVWGTITTSGNTLAIDIIPAERRGEGIGYYGMAMNIAMACGPLTGLLLSEHHPFVDVFFTSILSGVLGLLLALLMRVPAQIPHAHRSISLNRFLLVKGIPSGFALLFITISYGVTLAYVAMYGKEHHIPNTGFFFVALAAGIVLARVTTGKLLDRNLCAQMGVVGGLLTAASLLFLGLYPVAGVYFLLAFSLGFGYGMTFPAVQMMIINFGSHHQRGTANSTYFTAFDLGVGTGMLLGGQIAQRHSLALAFLVVAGSALLGTLLLWAFHRQPTA